MRCNGYLLQDIKSFATHKILFFGLGPNIIIKRYVLDVRNYSTHALTYLADEDLIFDGLRALIIIIEFDLYNVKDCLEHFGDY